MVVYTTGGSLVSFEHTDHKSLFDRDGVEWERYPEGDVQEPFGCAYRETKNHISYVLLTRDELKRTIAGDAAMNTPTTVMELRYYALHLPKHAQLLVDMWTDQRLREILVKADEKHTSAAKILEQEIEDALPKPEPVKVEQEVPAVTRESTSERVKPKGGTKRPPRGKLQKGGIEGTFHGQRVMLTPKQVEFIERLSENTNWDKEKENGCYLASTYAEELSDTMNPMAVGAVLTTLREKGILHTESFRRDGSKSCVFSLTELGKEIYRAMSTRVY